MSFGTFFYNLFKRKHRISKHLVTREPRQACLQIMALEERETPGSVLNPSTVALLNSVGLSAVILDQLATRINSVTEARPEKEKGKSSLTSSFTTSTLTQNWLLATSQTQTQTDAIATTSQTGKKTDPTPSPDFTSLDPGTTSSTNTALAGAAGASLSMQFDFGTRRSPVQDGSIGFSTQNYSSTVGYGWQNNSGMNAVDRGGNNPLTRDGVRGRDNTFVVDLPNGTYTVTAVLGDQSLPLDNISVYAEGSLQASNISTAAGSFATVQFNVDVKDGQLNLRFVDQGGSNGRFTLAGLNITPVSPTPAPAPLPAPLPTANAGPDQTVNEGSVVSFQGTATGTGLTYQWDFGDGTTASGSLNPTHVYNDNGTYLALLTVTDNQGQSSQDAAIITVGNINPTANFGASTPATEGGTVTFSFSNQQDPSLTDVAAGFKYSYDFNNDGTWDLQGVTNTSAVYTYDDNGDYTVKGRITDKDGGYNDYSVVAHVSNVAPTATFVNSGPAMVGDTVSFTFKTPFDPSGADTTAGFKYSYDFNNDGTWDIQNSASATANYTFATPGTFTVKGRITDKDGGFTDYTSQVTIGSTQQPSGTILLTSAELADLRQKAASNTAQWQAFKSRLDQNLTKILSDGAYQGSELTWIADYSLGYQILKDSDSVTASKYADKAIALIKSGLNDYQKYGEVTRQFLTRGDGVTSSFVLPNQDIIPSSVNVYISNVTTKTVVRGTGAQDAVDYYQVFLKVSNTPDGAADYTEGIDWRRNSDLPNNMIDWSLNGKEPAAGSTYYVTESANLGINTVPFTLNGNTITLNAPLAKDKAIFVEYIYGTHAADGSSLAYQQTSAGDGGFNSIFIDTTYSSRYLGKNLAIGYDWLYDYKGFSESLKLETAAMLVRWSDYIRDYGYYGNSPESNYGAGGYVSRMFTALALSSHGDPNGARLIQEITAYRETYVLPALQDASTSLKGGYWAEGWSYGAPAASSIIQAGLAFEAAGLGSASAEREWANEVTLSVLSEQPTQQTIYDGGDWYTYPTPVPGKEFFYVLAAASTNPTTSSYINYVIQNYPAGNTSSFLDLLYRDPSASASFWSDLPLQYKADGTGLVTARADWSYNSTWVSFQLGNLLNADHQSLTPGQLEIQRGADGLLINANVMTENWDMTKSTGLGNAVVIDDNGDGLQRYRFNSGYWYGDPGVYITAYEASSNYVYTAGDYRASYSPQSNPGGPGPATELTRQVVYLRPDFIVVHDRAGTVKDTYPKQLRWNFANAPVVNGNSWVETAGSSKLFAQTFSSQPLNTTAQSVTVNGTTVNQVITSNANPSLKVRYTTALQTAPSSTGNMVATTQVVSTDGRMEGVQMDSQVVLFGTDGAVDPTKGAITYSVSGSGTVSHLLTDMQAGRTYQIKADGVVVGSVTASAQGTLSFTTTAAGAQMISIA